MNQKTLFTFRYLIFVCAGIPLCPIVAVIVAAATGNQNAGVGALFYMIFIGMGLHALIAEMFCQQMGVKWMAE